MPARAVYTPDGKWAVENHGVDPDINVEDLPADLLAGHDAQLETAVKLMLDRVVGTHAGLPRPNTSLTSRRAVKVPITTR